MFIMVGIVYKKSKIYGYRIVNYIENQKQHEIKDCSIDQIKLAVSRGAKIENLAIKNNKIIITKGRKTDYERIAEGKKDPQLGKGYRFAYIVKTNNKKVPFRLIGTDGVDVGDSILLNSLRTITNYYIVPNICDAYANYTGEQLPIDTPKGLFDTIMTRDATLNLIELCDTRLITIKATMYKYLGKDIKYMSKSNIPLIDGYLVGNIRFCMDGTNLELYKGLSDFINSENINNIPNNMIDVNYDGNVFNKALLEPDELQKYTRLKEHFILHRNSELCFVYNSDVKFLLYRKIGNKGIVYKVKINSGISSLTIEQIYYNTVNNVETYKNVILKGNILTVYALDGVMLYDIDKIHTEYQGRVRESQMSLSNRLLGIKHTEYFNDRHELLKLITDSKNVVIDDNIVKVMPYAVTISPTYNKRLIIGKSVQECNNGIGFTGRREDLSEFKIIVKCKITKELLSNFTGYIDTMDLCNILIDGELITNLPSVAYTHNYRIKLSDLKILVRQNYSTVVTNSIKHIVKSSNLTIEEIKRCSNTDETLIHIQ